MTTIEIRKKFIEFFAGKKHAFIVSDSLVPKDDPTVLFTTAGMQQFKKQFLGQIDNYTRAVTSQKCLRTDDLDQVGVTAFHHTFFEMLGNFSFGDYFKKEAIAWAWEFLTRVIQIPDNKLWISVYKEDKEAKDIWLKDIKIAPSKIVELGDKSNFWPSEAKTKGPNGPCGPCSEIFFDYGPEIGCKQTDCSPACDCGRFAEIWNLVFTQYDRQEDGLLKPLPNKNIDTGMGLERLAAVVQGKSTNFEIDLFVPILSAIDANARKHGITLSTKERCVMADHMRAIVFGIADGVIPSNEGRGYVIKKLIADITDIILSKTRVSFIHQLVPSVVEAMKDPYKELSDKQENITSWIQKTETAYHKVRNERIPELKKELELIKNDTDAKKLADIFFKYRDTYGLTYSAIRSTTETVGIAQNLIQHGLRESEIKMDQQREKSRAASKMTGDVFTTCDIDLARIPKTQFCGYEKNETKTKIIKLFSGSQGTEKILAPSQVRVILSETPFYAESGGQVADTGTLTTNQAVVDINHTYKINDVFVHVGIVKEGTLAQGDTVVAQINRERRMDIMRNHTATHLLQSALRRILGTHVQQQGSLVSNDRLRFDFTHPKALTSDEIIKIEDFVNERIRECTPVKKAKMSLLEATKQGALAFFAEKYHQEVRVVSVGETSKELCGGTHLDNVGEVGLFKILSEGAVAQGVRRIEATTGRYAIALIHDLERKITQAASILKAPKEEVVIRLENQTKKIKDLEKKLATVRLQAITASLDEMIKSATMIKDVKCICKDLSDDEVDMDMLKKITDMIKQKARSAVITVGVSTAASGTALVTAVTDDLIAKNINANEIIAKVSESIAGSGGGRPQLAQAGSKERRDLNKTFQYIENLIKQLI